MYKGQLSFVTLEPDRKYYHMKPTPYVINSNSICA